MARKRSKRSSAAKSAPAASRNALDPNTVRTVAYTLIAVLVVATSFWTGYLAGLGNSGAPTQAVGAQQQVGQAPPPPPQGAPVQVEMGSMILGNPDAPVQIVEFSSYQCPFSKRAFDQTFQRILQDYVDQGIVSYSVRHFPLSFQPQSQKAHEAAECAARIGGPEAFWELHTTIYANQQAITVPDLKRYAQQIGLPSAEFDSCLDGGQATAAVNADASAGSQVGASGTPTFFINGRPLVGAQPYESFVAAIDAALN